MFVKDHWILIGGYLSKGDLVATQIALPEIKSLLDRIPEIWYGKHYVEYIGIFNVYYNGFEPTNQQETLYKFKQWRHQNKCCQFERKYVVDNILSKYFIKLTCKCTGRWIDANIHQFTRECRQTGEE